MASRNGQASKEDTYISRGEKQTANKRIAEDSPDKAKKRAAFCDLTNAVSQVLAGKKALQVSKKPEKKSSRKHRNTRNVPAVPQADFEKSNVESLKSSQETSSQESSVNDDSKTSVSSDSLSETSNVVSSADVTEKTEAEDDGLSGSRILPVGVEDFDKESLGDPFAEPKYAMDIFDYYKTRESQFQLDLYMGRQPEVSKGMRAVLTDWLVEVQESFELNHETLYLAVKFVDHYLKRKTLAKTSLQLLGSTAIFVACKFDERCPPSVDDFLYICDDAYTRKQLLSMEMDIIKTLEFDLGIPLSYRFLRRFARCAKVSMEILTLARYILESSLMEYELVVERDSLMAAACLHLALRMKGEAPDWTPCLQYYSGYREDDLLELESRLNHMIASPTYKNLSTVKTKYSHRVFLEVAKIPCLPLNDKQ